MKYIITLLMFLGISFANTHKCFYDPFTNKQAQIESCKLQILRDYCDQQKIAVWSTSTVRNNSLQTDEIQSLSNCIANGIQVTSISLNDSMIVISYIPTNEVNEVREVTMDQWAAIGPISTTQKLSGTKVDRPDSTSLIDVALSFQIDSRKIKEKMKKLEDKTKKIIEILKEDD